MDNRESNPSNVEARTGTPITGSGVNAATIPAQQKRPHLVCIEDLQQGKLFCGVRQQTR